MILYQLRCDKGHEFEAWFKGSAGFDAQSRRGEVECPFCGTTKVAKAPMAPNVVGGRARAEAGNESDAAKAESESGSGRNAALTEQAVEAVRRLRRQVEENCDYVGGALPEEARRIHYGEDQGKDEARGIYGEATLDEARELDEEGIKLFRLPGRPRRDG